MTYSDFLYSIAERCGGFRFSKIISRKHPKILMYHRLSESGGNGTVSVDHFREQMNIVKKFFYPMTLDQLMKAETDRDIPNHSVVITFDDGYQDFAKFAWPIMQEENVPATLFVTTGFVNRETWLWPDKIEYAINHAKKESIKPNGFQNPISLKDKRIAWNKIASYCLILTNRDKNLLLEWIYQELDVELPKLPPEQYCALTWLQIQSMVDSGLDVGSHSHTHPILTKIDNDELHKEIYLSRNLIKRNLGFEPKSFCYPNGMEDDYNKNIKNILDAAGYQYAVTAYPSRNPLDDHYAIKRYAGVNSMRSFKKTIFGISYLQQALRA